MNQHRQAPSAQPGPVTPPVVHAPPPLQMPPAQQPPNHLDSSPMGSRKLKKLLLIVLTALVALVLLTAGGIFIWYQSQLQPRTDDPEYHVVTVPSGSSTAAIGVLLEDAQVIKSATAFQWYTRLSGAKGLQAGSYRLSSASSVSEIVTTLEQGKVSTLNVLIPPGLRVDQILERLEKAGYSRQELDSALRTARTHSLLENVPSSARLEGYLFPDTYQIAPDTSAEQVIRLMLDNFQKQLTPAILGGIEEQNLTFEQAVTLASIVQQEVPDAPTQRQVAQVFLRRLATGMPLGADPTFRYAAYLTGQQPSPAIDSPYNTRRYGGLPPTAIGNFNLQALQAVADPAETTYLYFVAGDDGKTHFSNTLEEHEALTRRYCTTLCR